VAGVVRSKYPKPRAPYGDAHPPRVGSHSLPSSNFAACSSWRAMRAARTPCGAQLALGGTRTTPPGSLLAIEGGSVSPTLRSPAR